MYLNLSWILLGFSAQNGIIVGNTTDPWKYTTLTIKSNTGHKLTYTITRQRGGGNMDEHTNISMECHYYAKTRLKT